MVVLVATAEQAAETARRDAAAHLLTARQEVTEATGARTRAEADKSAAERRATEDRATTDRVRAELEQLRTEHHAEVQNSGERPRASVPRCDAAEQGVRSLDVEPGLRERTGSSTMPGKAQIVTSPTRSAGLIRAPLFSGLSSRARGGPAREGHPRAASSGGSCDVPLHVGKRPTAGRSARRSCR